MSKLRSVFFVFRAGGCVASASQIHAALDIGADSSAVHLVLGVLTTLVASGHFGLTAGKLLYWALFRPRDTEILKLYHNDYAPIKGSFRESMVSFDTQVGKWRTVHGRPGYAGQLRQSLERISAVGKSFEKIRGSGRWLASKLGGEHSSKSCWGCGKAGGGAADGGSSRGSFVSRVSFDRGQMVRPYPAAAAAAAVPLDHREVDT